jgi:hypothetical protein
VPHLLRLLQWALYDSCRSIVLRTVAAIVTVTVSQAFLGSHDDVICRRWS